MKVAAITGGTFYRAQDADQLRDVFAQLPKQITLIHGPGCPVCVTPIEQIDRAIAIAAPTSKS